MPGETVTIQAGQCGNQVGLQYWNQLAHEHGIKADGTPITVPDESLRFETRDTSGTSPTLIERHDRADLFFTLSSTNKYIPRALLVDLEPSVINKCSNTMPMFNPRNIHLNQQGNGAANNWNAGYSYGLEHQEELINLIDRECDKCENLSCFQLMHSVAGGTGSGVGSLMLELLCDRYGNKKMVNTFLIFPSNDKTSDVVVQPYNTILTLQRLIEFSDGTFVFDNDALNRIENTLFGSSATSSSDSVLNINNSTTNKSAAFEEANKIIAFVMASISNPLRFPTYMYSSTESILSTLVPTPELKFLSTSIAPFANLSSSDRYATKYNFTNLNEYDITLELLNDRYKMNKITGPIKYISMLNYLIGNDLNQHEICKGTLKAQQRVEFVPWTSPSIHSVNCQKSPYLQASAPANKSIGGIQISNNTSIIHVFTKIVKQFDLLAKREAYINFYTDSNGADERRKVLDIFQECRESVVSTIDEYSACQNMSYLEDGAIEVDDII